jgi:hypothetical protein
MMEDATTARMPPVARTLNMPYEMYEAIKKMAEDERRSFNHISIRLLKAALKEIAKEDSSA